MRTLIYVPIIHTEADMGSMTNLLRDRYIKEYGEEKWFDHVNKINNMWDNIEKRLETLNLSYKGVKIYQDGLPNCGSEGNIVCDIAQRGSKNHQLILKLLGKGAQLIGTEDVGLLVEEYKIIREILGRSERSDEVVITEYQKQAERRLFERDSYISRRIDETLKDTETGILFIGMMHKIKDILPKDIKIVVIGVG